MNTFDNIKRKVQQREPIQVDSAHYVKMNLLKSVDRTPIIRFAIQKWLCSFDGGITRKAFDAQMKRLDWNDDIALKQLCRAKGHRTIPLPPPPEMPQLDTTIAQKLANDELYVAVYGRKFKSAIKNAIMDLTPFGTVYVLEVEKLILEFKDYEHKGAAPQMIDSAIEADFLIIVNLEMPIHLEWHIHEAISRIGRQRQQKKKPIISTWCRYNDCNDFFERFNIYNAR